MTKAELIDCVRDYLDSNDWNYDYNDMKGTIVSGVNLKSKLSSTKLFFVFNDNGVTIYSNVSMKADEQTRAMALEFITRANYGIRVGNFEMDMSDGEIRYKVYINARGLDSISDEQIEEGIFIAANMLDRYGDGLLKVILGYANSAKEEIDAIENY
ncbi:MAG: YbjN domain-containing protein [Clostridiales bacterium]|nr:YbjN domain-containing protein [Clostridiales bacterium]